MAARDPASDDGSEDSHWGGGRPTDASPVPALTRTERVLLRRLVVFVGGWDPAVTARICAAPGLLRREVAPVLDSLVAKSVVSVATDGRYSLPAPVRSMAGQLWNEAMEESDEIIRRHWAWCLELAELAATGIERSDRASWCRRLGAEHANLRTGFTNALNGNDSESALRIAAALAGWFAVRGRAHEGRAWLALAEESGAAPSLDVVARARWAFCHLSLQLSELAGMRPVFDESVELARAAGDVRLEARSLLNLGLLMSRDRREPTTEAVLEESWRMADGAGDHWCVVHAMAGLAWMHMDCRRLVAARSTLEDAVLRARVRNEEAALETVLPLLALVAFEQGDVERASEVATEALVCGEELSDPQVTARASLVLSDIALHVGDLQNADKHARRAVALCRGAWLRGDLVDALWQRGQVAERENDHDAARRHYAEAAALSEASGLEVPEAYLGLAGLAVSAGDTGPAWALLEKTVALAAGAGFRDVVLQARAAMASLLEEMGQSDRAASELGQALATAGQGPPSPAVATVVRLAVRLLARANRRVEAGKIEGMALADAVVAARAELASLGRPGAQIPWHTLTKRERAVVELAGQGLTNVEIGQRLFVSEATVKTHLWRAFPKLGVTSRRGLLGLVPPSDADSGE